MAKRVHVDPAALDEVEHASITLDDSRGLGQELLEAFEAAKVSIGAAPEAVAPLRRSRSGFVVRSKLIRRFRYRVVFVDLPHLVWVIAFSHQRQHPSYWQERLKQSPPT